MGDPRAALGRLWDQIVGRFDTDWTSDDFLQFVWKQRICRYLKYAEDFDEYAQMVALSVLQILQSNEKPTTLDIKRSIWRTEAQLRRTIRQASKQSRFGDLWVNLPAPSPSPSRYEEWGCLLTGSRELSEMTPLELLVLDTMIVGTPAKQVAKELGMSSVAIRKIRSRLVKKLRCLFSEKESGS